jgi:hypothetical protein
VNSCGFPFYEDPLSGQLNAERQIFWGRGKLIKNLLIAIAFIGSLFLLYIMCRLIGFPLYPYGLLLFLIPFFGLIPLFQYLSQKEIKGYELDLQERGLYTVEQLETMSNHEIKAAWLECMRSERKVPSDSNPTSDTN